MYHNLATYLISSCKLTCQVNKRQELLRKKIISTMRIITVLFALVVLLSVSLVSASNAPPKNVSHGGFYHCDIDCTGFLNSRTLRPLCSLCNGKLRYKRACPRTP